MDITLNYETLYGIVSRSLSVIGKRSRNEDGTPDYESVTLGSKEKEIISDYFRQAAIDLSTELSTFITASTNTSVTFTLALPVKYNEALEPFIVKSCEAYCVSYALYSWFDVALPRIAPRYLDDCKRQLAAVIRLIHDKKAPEAAASSPTDISTNVS